MTLDEIDDELLSLIPKAEQMDDETTNRFMKKCSQSDNTVAYEALTQGYVDEFDLRGYLEEVTGYEALDPMYFDWDNEQKKEMTRLIPADLMQDEKVMPVNKKNNVIKVIMINPDDSELKRELQSRTGCRVDPHVSHEKALDDAFEQNLDGPVKENADVNFETNGYFFDTIDRLKQEVLSLINSTEDWRTSDDRFMGLLHQTPVLLLTQEIMNQVMYDGGSDIHFESLENAFRIRVRRDGKLRTLWEFPKSFGPVICGRIRLCSELDPRPSEKPQDSRIGYSVIYGRSIEYRVSCLPTLHGEKIVLRTIDLDEASFPLDQMGMSERDYEVIEKGIHQPTGMVLITGPTGSGKTTTLYSVIDERNEEEVSITTAEDPIEAQLEDVAQVPCDPNDEGGVAFSEALKSFLRQDPDIIMVGEIRDRETGEIAIEAAMTGHLVLSTLHTNSAPETVNRLLNMEIKPYLIAAGLSVVVSQRLIRTLCENCKRETDPPVDVFNRFNLDPSDFEGITFYEPVGCEHCDQGYSGRIGLFEILEIDDQIRESIFENESTQEIRERASGQDFTTLVEDGIRKVEQGITTLEEVMSTASM